MFESMTEKITAAGLIPVVKLEDPDKAVPLAESLCRGGVRMIELTFRTANGEAGFERIADCISRVKTAHPEMIVGAGTVTSASLAERAQKAGAEFVMSPGYNPETVAWCIAHSLPVYPGVSGAGDVERAAAAGLSVVKFFPAEISGGVPMIKALHGPFPSMRFIPTGGINETNLGAYMSCPLVVAAGGSWMVNAKLIDDEQWEDVTKLAQRAVQIMIGFRFAHVGINFTDDDAAADGASFLSVFGFEGKENPASWFCGAPFELMKKNGRGTHGHIGLYVWNIERALAYLAPYGFHPVMETAKWTGEPQQSPLAFVYLDKEIAGFQIHLKIAS